MAKQLAVHIRPGATPASILAILSLVSETPSGFGNAKELLSEADKVGLGSYAELHSVPASMGLLDREIGRLSLSESGRALLNVRAEAAADLIHFLLYSGWHEDEPTAFLSSWAYRTSVDRYWEASPVRLTGEYLDRIVEETINVARDKFLRDANLYDEISFGRASLEGARKFLEAVQPKVIDSDEFSRRHFCPPELLVLALAYVYADDPDLVGSDVLLSYARREALCRACLLEPESLDRTLDWALGAYPHLISPGTTAGSYGRFVRFNKLPTLMDLAQ